MKIKETTLHAKVSAQFKRKSERVFARLGITTDTAINMFLAQVSERNGIPFQVALGGVGEDGTFWSEKIRNDSLTELYGDQTR